MLDQFSIFMAELEEVYIKELNYDLTLKFLENFYKNFLRKNINLDPGIVNKTIKTIIVATDSILIEKGAVKEEWKHKTGENYLLNMNRGVEIIDITIKDILDGILVNSDLNSIVMIILLKNIKTNYKQEFFEFFENQENQSMNVKTNLKVHTINRVKKKKYPLLYIFFFLFFGGLLITEIYYYFSLFPITNSAANYLVSIRRIYNA